MKPIIMSTEDVRGILDGRKTMARLVAKELDGVDILNCRHVGCDIQEPKGYPIGHVSLTECCKFKPGDVLWVRETWGDYGGQTSHYIYRADYPLSAKGYWHEKEHINWCDFPKWNSPVTMPREAARLFLRVKDVRVEKNKDSGQWEWVYEFERTPSGAIGPEPGETAPNGDKGATHE